MNYISGIAKDVQEKLHDAIAETANLTDQELAERAGCEIKVVKRYKTAIKNRILEAAETEREQSRELPDYFGTHEKAGHSKEEYERLLSAARKERDEWEHRYRNLQTKYDDLVQTSAYTDSQLKKLTAELEDANARLDTAAQLLEKAAEVPQETRLRLVMADILLEKWEADHAAK